MERPKAQDSEIPKKLDRYELNDRIGAGGMGLIFKGVDTRLQRPVAIKIISDRVQDPSVRKTIRERFFNEARAAGGLSHSNLVQIYDCGEIDEVAYIVMEYIEGETLEELLKSKGPLNIEELLRIGREVASGLAFAHKKGIVHRDVKPSNIIIEANSGVSKILDFGIAKFINEEDMKLTSTGMVLGSTHYLSPEHIIGKNLDGRSDLFCLGTLLYEASTGTLPFRGANSSNILYKIVHFDPQPPHELRPELPQSISNLIMKCLKKSPAERFQKGEEVEKLINEIQNGILSERLSPSGATSSASSTGLKSHFVRDSQVLSALQTQKKLSTEEIAKLKGKPVVETILRDDLLPEDDLARLIAEVLGLPWIPRGRLKSLKIMEQAFQSLPVESMQKNSIIPFFRDNEKKTLSLIIDGSSDFQKDPEVADLASKIQLQFYVCGRPTIQRLIDQKIRQAQGHTTDSFTFDTEEQLATSDVTQKRVLLVDNQPHHHESLIKLFKRNENALIIAADLTEAKLKLKRERFDFVWVYRALVGDELEFEMSLLKGNPQCEIRFYDSLAIELFQESVSYQRYREFYNRITHMFLSQIPSASKSQVLEFASLAAKIAKPQTENIRVLDEVYFSAVFWKLERLKPGSLKVLDIFDGVYRLRTVFDAIGERFDGRGPLGLKDTQIPLAARVLTAFIPFDTLHPSLNSPWSDEQVNELIAKYQQYSGKQLDPVISSAILDQIRPIRNSGKLMKVAIVDSDVSYSSQLAAQLKSISVDATVYNDGVAALAGIKKNRPDLIISEVMVSKLDGFALCARLRGDEMLKKIPLVFVSESNAPEHSTKAIQLGAEDFILKTSEPGFIMAKIEKMIKRAS